MEALQLTFFRCDGYIATPDGSVPIGASTLVVDALDLSPIAADPDRVDRYRFRVGDLRQLSRDLLDILPTAAETNANLSLYRCVPFDDRLCDAALRIGKHDKRELLRFVYAYCAATDPEYFAHLLRQMLSERHKFIAFVEEHSLNPWPASTYAQRLGTSLRALNVLFRQSFGVSVKHWLLEQRLQHARHLLAATSMKVTDVALESGFSSHAYFSTCFRRRYKDCPRTLRQTMQVE
jgi:AraC-like DNA-binding protein